MLSALFISIFFFRHAETDWNHDMLDKGHLDLSLNDNGRAKLVELLPITEHLKPYILISSQLKRARETADILFPNNAKVIDFRIAERNHYDETAAEFKVRVNSFTDEYFVHQKEHNTVIVSHGGVFRILTEKLFGERQELERGSAVELIYSYSDDSWEMIYL